MRAIRTAKVNQPRGMPAQRVPILSPRSHTRRQPRGPHVVVVVLAGELLAAEFEGRHHLARQRLGPLVPAAQDPQASAGRCARGVIGTLAEPTPVWPSTLHAPTSTLDQPLPPYVSTAPPTPHP